MIKKSILTKHYLSDSHTIVTGFRHKQQRARLIPSTKKHQKRLVSKNVVIYVSKDYAVLNYRYGFSALPNVEKNL
jgi:hypothetical protein